MSLQATHPPLHLTSRPGTRRLRPARLVKRTRARAVWTHAWKIAIVSLGIVSLAGALALAIGRGPTAFVLLAAGASVITGVLGHLAPRPDPSEVIRPSKGEAF